MTQPANSYGSIFLFSVILRFYDSAIAAAVSSSL